MKKSLVQKLMQPIIFILLLPFKLIRFFCLGLFFTSYALIGFVVTTIGNLIKYTFLGIVVVSKNVFDFGKTLFLTILKIPVFIYHVIRYAYLGILQIATIIYHSIKCILKYSWLGICMVADILIHFIKLVGYGILGLFLFIRSIIRYACLGLLRVSDMTYRMMRYSGIGLLRSSTTVYHGMRYALMGCLTISLYVYHWMRYVIKGLEVPFIFLFNILYRLKLENDKQKEAQRLRNEKLSEAKRLERERLLEAQRKKAEEYRKKKEKDVYVNPEIKIKKKTFGDKLNDFIERLISAPSNFVKSIKNKIYNSSFAKDKRNRQELSRNVLLVDYEGEDAVRSPTKQLYEYEATDANGKYVKNYFEAYSKVEVHSYLLSEGFTVYSIRTNKWIQLIHALESTSQVKIKTKDLIFFLTQLSTYIKAGIPLVDSLRVLERQYRNKNYKRIFKVMIYELTMGENFSTAMERQGKAFPSLLINMVKTSEMTGNLPEVLDDMAEYYTEMDKTKKEMITAMTYPTIVLIVALGVTTFIMMFVIPKFVEIYESMDASKIPGITIFIMNLSAFLQKYFWLVLLGVVLFVGLVAYCYKNVKSIRKGMQWLTMHLPVFGNIVIFNEVTMFTKTFASLLEHNVFITDCMDILNKVTNNEIYHMLIRDTIANLARGEKISTSFEGHWAFPIPAYEMLVTGEKTGELPQMMKKVSEYYQDLHRNAVGRVKTFMEPLLIIFLTAVVGVIVLAIVIPMFNMYNTIEQV